MRLYNCERCFRRKQKCSRSHPCTSCARAGANCVYPVRAPSKRRRQAGSDNANDATLPQRPSPYGSFSGEPLSYLNLTAAGEPRVQSGASGGIHLADLVGSRLATTATRAGTPDHEDDAGNIHVSTPVSRTRRAQALPSQDVANRLIRAYLNHDAIAYPFLLPAFLLETTRRFYEEPDYYARRATAFEAFAFNMVLAIATSRVQKGQWGNEIGPQAYNAHAMRDIDPLLASGKVECLQALLLLCQYRLSSPVRDNSVGVWHLIGFAVRLCIELGLHRETSYPITSVDGNATPDEIAKLQDQEIQRRCFWSLVSMDRIVSLLLSRPFGIHDDDIGTELPRDDSDTVVAPDRNPGEVVRIAVSRKIFRYRLLCGQVSQHMQGRRFNASTPEDIARVTQLLADRIDEWHKSAPRLETHPIQDGDRETVSCYLSAEWFDLLAANASLMLWRPQLLLPEPHHNWRVLDSILSSASSAITIYADLHAARKINYNWITLQAVFLAGVSYVSTVTQHFRQRRTSGTAAITSPSQDPSPGDVVRTTRACSKVLVALGERMDLPSYCHEVFDRLSDAAVSDAMQSLSTNSTPQQPEIGILQQTMVPMPSHDMSTANAAPSSWHNADIAAATAPPLIGYDEFLSCFDDLQQHYFEGSTMDLSQDWLGTLGAYSGY